MNILLIIKKNTNIIVSLSAYHWGISYACIVLLQAWAAPSESGTNRNKTNKIIQSFFNNDSQFYPKQARKSSEDAQAAGYVQFEQVWAE